MASFKMELTGVDETLKRVEGQYHEFLERVADTMVQELKAVTPVATGRAQAGWRRTGKKEDIAIENAVPYVQYLEKPFVRSKKAPRGMIGPALNSTKGKFK
jgi:hypothetical protein